MTHHDASHLPPSVYDERGLLTVKQYADLVGQHPMSVYRRIRESRQSGVVRVGGAIRIDARTAIRIIE
jgi:hypothetical protein